MSVLFSLSTDLINNGSQSVLASIVTTGPGTILVWVYPTSTSTAGTFMRSATTAGTVFNPTTTALQINIGTSGTGLTAAATFANAASYGTNKWCLVACDWTAVASGTLPHLWHGDLVTPVKEVAAYSTQRSGTGAASAFGNWQTGGGNTAFFPGRMALIAAWNRVLTLGELEFQRLNPQPTNGCVLFMNLDKTSPAGFMDETGYNNNGVPTGTTQWDRLPPVVRFLRKTRPRFGRAAVFAAKFRKTLSGIGSRVGSRQTHGW